MADGFERLEEWGRPFLGAVTGNNKWFTLTAEQAADAGLTTAELLRLSPPGSRHLRGLTFTASGWGELRAKGRPVWLFNPADDPSPAALRLIAAGEDAGVDQAYKCRVRSPWWQVPMPKTPDLIFTYMNHSAPQLVANRARVAILNSVHGLTLTTGRKRLGMDLLPIAALNSATLLAAELGGRAYGGGMLKLEPREAAALPVPTVELVERTAEDLRAARPQIAKALRSADLAAAAKVVDPILLTAAGVRRSDQAVVRTEREAMFARRSGRGGRVQH